MKAEQSQILVLVENTTFTASLRSQHGLALAIFHHGTWILFDTGQDETIIHNMHSLGLSPSHISHIILSHGHYDHCGGLASLAEIITPTCIVSHPTLTNPKYRSNGEFIGTTMPERFHPLWRPVTTPTELLPGLWIVPSIPISHTIDTHYENLLVETKDKKTTDTFEDEIFVVLDHGDSISILTGCAHRGVTNTIEAALSLFSKPIRIVIGGFHLRHSSPEERREILSLLASYPVRDFFACHCTGLEAYHEMRMLLTQNVTYASTGLRITL